MVKEKEPPPPDPEKVKEYMFEVISAMGPRLFRPEQDAHGAYGVPQAEAKKDESLRLAGVLGAGVFLAGAATGVAVSAIWERRRHR